MCIALLTTAHPDYALIVLDNRDEFILRPTSRPHWWSPRSAAPAKNHGQNGGAGEGDKASPASSSDDASATPRVEVLSSRDLQRAERGTWMGISRSGNLAVLTNYREDSQIAVSGQRSRGAILNEWLGADPAEGPAEFVSRMLGDGDSLKGIGGFSLIVGKLRRRRMTRTTPSATTTTEATTSPKTTGATTSLETTAATQKQGAGHTGAKLEDGQVDADGQPEDKEGRRGGAKAAESLDPLAILSNRVDRTDQIPWIAGARGETHGLSNAIYADSSDPKVVPTLWPKVRKGMDLLRARIAEAIAAARDRTAGPLSEAEFVETLFGVLDVDDFPYPGGRGGSDGDGSCGGCCCDEMEFQQSIPLLKHTIFVPPLGGGKCREEMAMAAAKGAAMRRKAQAQKTEERPEGCVHGPGGQDGSESNNDDCQQQEEQVSAPMTSSLTSPEATEAKEALRKEARPDSPAAGFMTGLYGTQRQTVVLVDWSGNVTFTERALWDEHGNPVARGKGDAVFKFKIEGWDDGEEES